MANTEHVSLLSSGHGYGTHRTYVKWKKKCPKWIPAVGRRQTNSGHLTPNMLTSGPPYWIWRARTPRESDESSRTHRHLSTRSASALVMLLQFAPLIEKKKKVVFLAVEMLSCVFTNPGNRRGPFLFKSYSVEDAYAHNREENNMLTQRHVRAIQNLVTTAVTLALDVLFTSFWLARNI